MAGLWTLVLRWALLNFCDSAGSPEVWVRIQSEATTELPSFLVRCGFLGSVPISQVTVSWEGLDGAKRTTLAVLHPKFGIQQWAPAHQARWETQSSVSLNLTLEASKTRSHLTNATFCCEFTVFPDGSHSACGDPLASSDQGLPALTPASVLRADLAGIVGASGVLLLGFIFIIHLLHQQRHRSATKLWPPLASTQMQMSAQTTSQASLAAFHLPYTTTTLCPAVLETDPVHLDQLLPWWAPLPTHPPPGSRPVSLAFPPASAPSGFISVENALYDQGGDRLPHTGPNLPPAPDPLQPASTLRGHLGDG